jgi:hypothetical protein
MVCYECRHKLCQNCQNGDYNKDTPLNFQMLAQPNHPVPQLMLTLYTIECYLYKSLNKAIRFGDESKVDSLGPYAQVMNAIVGQTIKYRDDLDSSKFDDLKLYHGSCLTLAQIK